MTNSGCRRGQLFQIGLWGQTDLDVKCSSATRYGLASMSPCCKMGTEQCLAYRVGVRISGLLSAKCLPHPHPIPWQAGSGCPQGGEAALVILSGTPPPNTQVPVQPLSLQALSPSLRHLPPGL